MSRFLPETVRPIEEFTRSAIYRFSFAFTAFVFLADITNVVGFSPYGGAIKYIYTAIVGALLYHYFSRFESVSTRSAAPPLALAFWCSRAPASFPPAPSRLTFRGRAAISSASSCSEAFATYSRPR
jgi:hypothetical protein